jgi:hypothetical protein
MDDFTTAEIATDETGQSGQRLSWPQRTTYPAPCNL